MCQIWLSVELVVRCRLIKTKIIFFSQMLHALHGLTRKAPSQPQKEVFDTLKSRDDAVFSVNPRVDDDKYRTNGDGGQYLLREEFEVTDSGVLDGSSTYSSSGARSYSLVQTTPGTVTSDGFIAQVDVNEPYLQSMPTLPTPLEGPSGPFNYIKYSQPNRSDSGCYTKAVNVPEPYDERNSLPVDVVVHA